MSEISDIKSIIARINTNSDEMITQEELQNAQGKVPSLWLEKIAALAAGQEVSAETVLKGLGVEPRQKEQTSTTFYKENYFDYCKSTDCYEEPPVIVKSLEQIRLGSHDNIRDARNCDISELDLTLEQLLNLTIDKTTIMSDAQRAILSEYTEKMKNPGLGIRGLHEIGITGKGVKIAIIDQPLGRHKDYSQNLVHHESVNCEQVDWTAASMHGAAVASIAVGKEVGVAPDADLVYFSAVNITKDKSELSQYAANLREKLASEQLSDKGRAYFQEALQDIEEEGVGASNLPYAQAIEKILDMNKELSPEEKIPVISISWGFAPEAPGYDKLQEVLQRAKDEGVFVVSTALDETYGFNTCGANRNPQLDPDAPESYEAGAFWKDNPRSFEDVKDSLLLVPMDHRTTADFWDDSSYRYEGNDGGMSWSTPWIAGMYALAKQVSPDITPGEFWQKALETSNPCNNNDDGKYVGRLLNPEKLIDTLKK